jgi:branched-chain amino acid transport system substrate-binding protein
MDLSRRLLLGSAAAAAALPRRSRAADGAGIKIGVLNDFSGPYKDLGGMVSVRAVETAIADQAAGGQKLEAEVVFGDHQNKPDVGAGIARQWYDREGVDLIVDCPTSSVALAIAGVAKDKNKMFICTGAATSDLTGPQCNANTIHWTYDTYMLARSTGGAMVKSGGDSWFFITADYAYGHALQRDTTDLIQASGGKVLGGIAYPFPSTTDFSSMLLQAQASGAKVLGLANAGADTINSIKQAHEFGLNQQMKIAALLMFIPDVHALGLEIAQGLVLTSSWYWDLNDRTRAFSERLAKRAPGVRAAMGQAGAYAASLHYLKVAAGMGVAQAKQDGAATVERMKAMPTDDDCFGKGTIRVDGRKLHPAYLFEVKTPAESKGPWDYYKLLATTPADQAFRPLEKGGCPLVHA